MKRRIISIILLIVIVVISVSCRKVEKADLLNKDIVVTFSDPGHIAAAKDYNASIGGDFIEYSSASDAVVAVINGKADYVVLDEYTGYSFAKENEELEFLEKCDYNIEYSACFSMEKGDLCEAFNKTFAAMKADGTIDKIKSAVYDNKEYVVSEPTGDKGVLVMACDPIFDNRVYFGDDETITGVDVYIAKEVCNRLGYSLVIEKINFEDMFMALDNDEADFIMSSIERTDQRAEYYMFSDVYATYSYNVYKLK